ncbi:hypothetical protein AGDE_13643 [Angomonas deanei]|uniref:Uncharacterized protein n=1 Tax=Angomonas deanei TaxID=59799 RepID=A0A7G2CNB5_9TRYP|nr:hypothetical protein AGDE_13643 [Angomonas deanei]CAD2220083.1 hypothetical protein, conserved [Angomonas deanei]|eukprot:EPY21947.1 hypothetical protein AGDE_13643 [Angomonas deanei]
MSVHFDASKGVESGDTAGQSTSETYSNSTYSSRQDPPRRAAAKQQTTKSGKSFPGKMVEAIQLKLSSSKKPKNVDNTRQYSSSGSYADTYSTGDSGSSYSYYSYSTGSTATSGSSYYSWSSVRIPQNNKNQEKKSTGAPKTAAQTSLKEKKPRGDLSFDTTSRDESNNNHHNNNTSHEKQLSQAGTLPSFFVGDKISLGTASNEGGDLQDIRDNIKNLLLARSTRDKPSPGLSASVMIPSSAFPDVDNNNNSISLNASSAPNGRTSRSPSLINPETEMDLLNQQRRAPSLPPEILEGNEELKEGALIPLFKHPPRQPPYCP